MGLIQLIKDFRNWRLERKEVERNAQQSDDEILNEIIDRLNKERNELYKTDIMGDYFYQMKDWDWDVVRYAIKRTPDGINSRKFCIYGENFTLEEYENYYIVEWRNGCRWSKNKKEKHLFQHPVEFVIKEYLNVLDSRV